MSWRDRLESELLPWILQATVCGKAERASATQPRVYQQNPHLLVSDLFKLQRKAWSQCPTTSLIPLDPHYGCTPSNFYDPATNKHAFAKKVRGWLWPDTDLDDREFREEWTDMSLAEWLLMVCSYFMYRGPMSSALNAHSFWSRYQRVKLSCEDDDAYHSFPVAYFGRRPNVSLSPINASTET